MSALLQFQMTTDYAIRILGYLAAHGNRLTQASELAERSGITYPYTMKIIRQLKTARLLNSERGPQGGYRISKNPAEITIYDVVVVMEGDICLNRCLHGDHFCSRSASDYCEVHQLMDQLQGEMQESLKKHTIADVAHSFG